MRKIAFVIMTFLLSFKGYCQGGYWMWGFYAKKQLPNELRNKTFKVTKKKKLGMIIENNWYRISKKPIDSTDELYWIIGTPDKIADTINVYTNDTETGFKLILTPNLKKSFQKVVREHWFHSSHASHVSHNSHNSHTSHYSSRFDYETDNWNSN